MKKSAVFLLCAALLVPLFASAKKDADYFLKKAERAFDKKSYKKTISLSNKALDLEPRSADAYYWKARALEAQKKPLEAANEYHAALLARPSFQEAQDGLSRVTSLLGPNQPDNTGAVSE